MCDCPIKARYERLAKERDELLDDFCKVKIAERDLAEELKNLRDENKALKSDISDLSRMVETRGREIEDLKKEIRYERDKGQTLPALDIAAQTHWASVNGHGKVERRTGRADVPALRR